MILNKGIAFKLSLFILTGITIIFSIIFAYNYLFSRKIIIKNIEKNAKNLAYATVNKIDMVLYSVEKIPQNLSYFMESSIYMEPELMKLLRLVTENNPEIYGAAIAFEPYAYSINSLYFAPYFYKKKGKIEFKYVPYNYFYSDWYQIPKELNRPVWSEPYFGKAGGIVMSTYSYPFYKVINGKRRFMGVIAVDISLSWLQKIVASIKIEQSGYGFLISKNGTFITHPNPKLIMNETIFSVAEEKGDKLLRKIGRDMIQGKTGFVPFRSIHTGKMCWMVFSPLSSNGWSLGVLFPQKELMADITHLNHKVLFIAFVGFIVIFLLIVLIASSITSPLRRLSRLAQDIATGNLDIEIPPIKSKDEVGKLTDSFNYMKNSLKQYIKDLTKAIAEKERIESELKIAHDIQMGILPRLFPPFPDRSEFDIYATVEPAREVGGDLYDFYFIDHDHFCFAVGDVSGKGVPASLFMAMTHTLLKVIARKGITPGEILTELNNELSKDNDSCMFVTIFLSILNTKTGELLYANGGHNPPLIIRQGRDVMFLNLKGGIAVGAMADITYKTERIDLKVGDSIFIYTDGVTEAINDKKELFSEDGLKDAVITMSNSSPYELVVGIMEKIKNFSHGVPQADDITMLVLKFNGAKD